MTKAFNLLDEPWLPVRLHDGHVRDVGLLELFALASEISALAESSPPSSIAEYRLLLAITHRALASVLGTWKDADRARWYREGLPTAAIHEYLEHWREYFWLFHPERPFMQVAALEYAEETCDRQKPWTQISLASANGNTPVIFDHAYDLAPNSISPALALRTLLGFLQFTPGGLVKAIRDSDKAGALANTAAVLPVGQSLGQTMSLALHLPPAATHADLPCWELPVVTIAGLRGDPVQATGPNDRYTRLSRAVLFLPEVDDNVRWMRFAAGLALSDDPNAPDPMASYRAGSNSLVRLTFSAGKAFWRDLPALIPDASGKASLPAAVLGFASNLHGMLTFSHVEQPLLVAGLASDQAKLLRWRSEQILLPAILLADAGNAALLRQLIGESESLFDDFRRIAHGMLVETLPDPASKDTRDRARSLFESGPATAIYFAQAERLLGVVMSLLAEGCEAEAEMRWRRTLVSAADSAWNALRVGMGQSPLALRADARHWPHFRTLLKKWQPKLEPDMAVLAEDA